MKHTVIITCFLAVLFLTAHVIGLGILRSYIDVEATKESGKLSWEALPSFAGMQVERPDVTPSQSIWYIFVSVIVGTLLILLIIKLRRALLWKLWFYFAVSMCLQIAFAAFVPASAALMLGLVCAYFKIFRPNVYIHNVTELFVYGGLAVIFVPILNVKYAFIMLLGLSVYDMYAVWRSKHMITMAKFQTESGIFAGLLIPYKRPAWRPSTGKLEKVRTAVLGGGDIGFPLIFSGTILATMGFGHALIVSLGATVALIALLLLSEKDKFYPAMPFLTAGCALGYLVAVLV